MSGALVQSGRRAAVRAVCGGCDGADIGSEDLLRPSFLGAFVNQAMLSTTPRRTNRPLTALATRLTLIHEEGRTGRCPRVLTDER